MWQRPGTIAPGRLTFSSDRKRQVLQSSSVVGSVRPMT